MNIEQEIRAQIEKNKGLKLAVGEINNHLSILEGLLRNERDDVQKQVNEAYQKGYDKGYADKTNNDEVCDGLAKDIYQRGLDDAWEAARKISLMSPDEIEKVFPGAAKYNRYNLGYSGVEAIEKLKAYEEKQKADDEIKVGDEVIYNGTTKCIVVRQEDDERYASLIDSDGTLYSADHRECKKTGRHFDIDKILEEMKE